MWKGTESHSTPGNNMRVIRYSQAFRIHVLNCSTSSQNHLLYKEGASLKRGPNSFSLENSGYLVQNLKNDNIRQGRIYILTVQLYLSLLLARIKLLAVEEI